MPIPEWIMIPLFSCKDSEVNHWFHWIISAYKRTCCLQQLKHDFATISWLLSGLQSHLKVMNWDQWGHYITKQSLPLCEMIKFCVFLSLVSFSFGPHHDQKVPSSFPSFVSLSPHCFYLQYFCFPLPLCFDKKLPSWTKQRKITTTDEHGYVIKTAGTEQLCMGVAFLFSNLL